MIVVDASVVVEVLLGTAAGRAAADRLFARGESLHAPELVDVEVAQAIRRYAAIGELKASRAREAIRDLEDFRSPATRMPVCCRGSGNFGTTSRRTTLPTSRWPRRCGPRCSRAMAVSPACAAGRPSS